MEKDIFLIRHAEALKIKDTRKYDISDQVNNEKVILSVNGEKLAKEISELQEMQNIDMVWSSNYVRALATAKYIAEKNNIEINVDNRLNERKLGDLKKLRELGKNKQDSYTNEQLKDIYLKNKEGESNNEVSERMELFIKDIISNDAKKIAIISHGASIKFWLSRYCEIDEQCNLQYNNQRLYIESPSVFNIKIKNKEIMDIKQIFGNVW